MSQFLCALALGFATYATGANYFQLDPLTVQKDLYVISSFEERDYFTVYSPEGTVRWEIPFSAKIVSWKIDDGLIYIFSKNRNGQVFYLSCFDASDGKGQWENPIFAPQSSALPTP